MNSPIEIDAGTPIADAVTRARAAFTRADAAGLDVAYREAVQLAADAGQPELRSALATDHTAQLLDLGHLSRALERCNEYLADLGPNHVYLRLLHAAISSRVGNHAGAAAGAAAVRAALGKAPHALTPDEHARLRRLEGLVAAHRGDLDEAARHLGAAERAFQAAGKQAGVELVNRDRLMIAVRRGEGRAVAGVLSGAPPRTVADQLTRVIALKRELRYETALRALLDVVETDFDPALRFPVLWELTVLLRLTRQNDTADQLFPYLGAAAAASPDPAARLEEAARLFSTEAPEEGTDTVDFDQWVEHARRLITEEKLDEAEKLLIILGSETRSDRDIATWHLAAGELELAFALALAQSEPGGAPSGDDAVTKARQEAVGHLSLAADRASGTSLVDLRAFALRLLGDACWKLDAHHMASECWAEACRLDEKVVERQVTDSMRLRMMYAVTDEHDARISAAAAALDEHPTRAATLVVAMEAARGATILARILRDPEALSRNLPKPSDLHGAVRWVKEIAGGLPRSQVVWIMHATPTRVHHAVIGRGFLHRAAVPSSREGLASAVDDLKAWWDDQPLENGTSVLEQSVTDGHFDEALTDIAERVGVGEVVPCLPSHVRRIAIVAGRELSDIPFAAIPMSGNGERLGHRFALSDLPCLSVRLPLHQQSRRRRGGSLLLVQPPSANLTWATRTRARKVLDDAASATRTGLRTELERHRYRQVRIDSHGRYNDEGGEDGEDAGDDEDAGDAGDAKKSWLQLEPEGPPGRLAPAELQDMNLSGCGTLVLGACESGMGQRTGRDEQQGFVRAAFYAGAASVVAARWIVQDEVAAAVLDRFQHHLRRLPRDVALQRAQLDLCEGRLRVPPNIPSEDHPAWWACWTLYGDSGWQARTGPGRIRRPLRHGAGALAAGLRRAVTPPLRLPLRRAPQPGSRHPGEPVRLPDDIGHDERG